MIVHKGNFMSEDTKQKLFDILDNLYYSWDYHSTLPVIDGFEEGWRRHPSPKSHLEDFGLHKLDELVANNSSFINESSNRLHQYLTRPIWFDKFAVENTKFEVLKTNPIAYFCMEFGLIDWLQIYSGGLGVLAGDYLKEVSDLGIPVVGVGIFYNQGYFHQRFSPEGRQLDEYLTQDPLDFPLSLVKDKLGNPLRIRIDIKDHIVYAQAWELKIGRVSLYLLDTNIDENKLQEDRMISSHLYGGDNDTRIRQEILLGIGGARLLKELDIDPSIFHMNEGHSGFLVLEIAKQLMHDKNIDFQTALKEVDAELVFTNHTLKPAGNDNFPYDLVASYLYAYCDDLNTNLEAIFELGRDDDYSSGNFSMTMLGFRHAKVSTAVSKLHGEAASKIWPKYKLLPVTNGTHVPTWLNPELNKLLEGHLGFDWALNPLEVDLNKIYDISYKDLWDMHIRRKHKLISSLNKELSLNLNPEALTIAWSRRLASYKRPDLIISDIERMKRIVNNSDRPVQILIAGKAHPRDISAVDLLQKINQELSSAINSELSQKVVVIPDYNWKLAKAMVSGSDVWLNTPFRFEEASGTSGMKACLNGVLQLTTLDGWTDEVDWTDKGFVVDHNDPVTSLHDNLEFIVAPLYFDRNHEGFNEKWVKMMIESIVLAVKNFSSTRMVKDYLDQVYSKILT
jgi:starch phosphorylase